MMKVLLTIWEPKSDEVREIVDLPLSPQEVESINLGQARAIGKVFRNTVRPYTKIRSMKNVTYNSTHKCASFGGDDNTDTIVKLKFIDLVDDEEVMYEL